jgi:hypothetical protein
MPPRTPHEREREPEAPRWERRADPAVAYAPPGTALVGGLVGVFASPNRWVGMTIVVGGVMVETFSTYWSRRKERRGRRDAD